MNECPPLSPETMKRSAKYLWGGTWRVALGRKVRMRPDEIEGLERSQGPVPSIIAEVLAAELQSRADGCIERRDSIVNG